MPEPSDGAGFEEVGAGDAAALPFPLAGDLGGIGTGVEELSASADFGVFFAAGDLLAAGEAADFLEAGAGDLDRRPLARFDGAGELDFRAGGIVEEGGGTKDALRTVQHHVDW